MAKRFGRNQKRKLQERVKFLEVKSTGLIEAEENSSRRLEESRRRLEDILRHLPQYFVGDDPLVIQHTGNPDYVRIPMMGIHDYSSICDPHVQGALIQAFDQELHTFKCEGKQHPLDGAIHILISHPEFNSLMYAINRTELKRMNKSSLVEHLGKQFAKMIAQELGK